MTVQYSIMQWLFFFYFYCFVGWCFESTYVSIGKRKPVNRGFMKGPFLPLYGTGAIMMLVVSQPFLEHWWAVYIAGCIGATVLEYITGVTMEALFKVRYWDYSNQKFNFQGHICLSSSLAWGLLTLLMNYVVHIPIESFVLSLPLRGLGIFTLLLTVYIVADFTLSFKEAMDLRDILVKMEKAKENLVRVQRRLDVLIAVADEGWTNWKEDIAEGVGQTKDSITETLTEYKDSIADKLKVDEIKDGIEGRLGLIRGKISSVPAKFAEEIKEELINLHTEYKMSREQRENTANRSMIRRIKNNPTMSSSKYKEALEELKKKAEERKKH